MRQQRKKNATQSRREKKKERKKIFMDLTRDLISFNLYRLLASLTVSHDTSHCLFFSPLFHSYVSLSFCVLSSPGYFAAGTNHSHPLTPSRLQSFSFTLHLFLPLSLFYSYLLERRDFNFSLSHTPTRISHSHVC